jgi:hypothetical protein
MIIGLTGFAGSGKSEVAQYISSTQRFLRANMKDGLVAEMKKNFPDLLREIALATDSKDANELFKNKPPLMRALMQNYGTEVRRKDNPNYWIHKWADDVDGLVRQGKNVVVDDVRFLNEAEAVKSRGGIIIRVVRENIKEPLSHSSETEMTEIEPDFTITVGEGQLDELFKLTDKVISEVKSNVD